MRLISKPWGSAVLALPPIIELTPNTDTHQRVFGTSLHGERPARSGRRVQSHGKRGRKPKGQKPWQRCPKA